MSLPILGAVASAFERNVTRPALLWTITRADGDIQRFTSHSNTIPFLGQAFAPSGGGDPTATRREGNLRGSDKSFLGMITSAAIDDNDLRAGLYRDALIEENLIDWRYPWAGPYETRAYTVVASDFDGESWEWTLAGISYKLLQEVGESYTRSCRHDLGDTLCTIDLGAITISGATVASVSTANSIFLLTSLPPQTHDYVFGQVVWLTGNNVGQTSTIKKRDVTELSLTIPTANVIQIGDTCDVVPGCPQTSEACINDYSNFINYGGQKDIPGTRKMLQSPTSVAAP